jgi:DNA-binding response OmpR family regulator
MSNRDNDLHSGPTGPADTTVPPILLVVDDHDDTRDMYDGLLSASGYWVACASTGLEAFEYARDIQPDVVITDLGLPGHVDGAELIRELRSDRSLQKVPVLVVTGREPRDLPSLAGLDISALLLKPVAPETLIARIQAALAEAALKREDT